MLNEEMSDFFVCVYLLTVMYIIYMIIIVKVFRGSACVLLVNPYIATLAKCCKKYNLICNFL